MATDPAIHIEAASTLAVIDASFAPLLLLDGELKVIAASASFCDAFEIDPLGITTRPLASLGHGEWKIPQLTSLLMATASGFAEIKAYEIDLIRKDRGPASSFLMPTSSTTTRTISDCFWRSSTLPTRVPAKSSKTITSGKGHPLAGGPAPSRQQPADHR